MNFFMALLFNLFVEFPYALLAKLSLGAINKYGNGGYEVVLIFYLFWLVFILFTFCKKTLSLKVSVGLFAISIIVAGLSCYNVMPFIFPYYMHEYSESYRDVDGGYTRYTLQTKSGHEVALDVLKKYVRRDGFDHYQGHPSSLHEVRISVRNKNRKISSVKVNSLIVKDGVSGEILYSEDFQDLVYAPQPDKFFKHTEFWRKLVADDLSLGFKNGQTLHVSVVIEIYSDEQSELTIERELKAELHHRRGAYFSI